MSKVAKRDRAPIGLPDVLLSSMRSFYCVIKCNMQIDLNNFYDPELNGCFKDTVISCMSTLHLGRQQGLEDARPETVFDTPLLRELGSIVKSMEAYAQFVDGSPPLVWTKNDVLGAKSQFKQKPHMLDIVLARYNDGCYYRAQIIEESDRYYNIFYVDYGNTQFVPLSTLATICPKNYEARLCTARWS